ncbi:hypothetical protein ABT246_16820, partial [Streptomyces sp. NPDC001553]|uniref:hypothetical protein n=1 Tax=Streptomyces sp. NPDC001553 TaxID=3154385 RepID=UPI003317C751
MSTTTFERPEPCRTLADQRQRACLNENRKPERWNPAPTRRDGRAITLSITNRRSRNGPPDEPTDRHKGDRSQARHQRLEWTLSPFLVAASSGLGEEALAGESSEAAAGD